ncbi:MAG: hypothetical protein JW744_04185 [Candidatus Diapherotrites archaeon]|uniref:Uncharacterized protein n=1 Tax=Candidatus Iainarchaeum sp. TaxID=3101447 RepID=A0A939CAD1_9ARCH|nr:hypothetical protein [Candidatus Diapherotrites archaeon]
MENKHLAGLIKRMQSSFQKRDSFGLRELGNEAIEKAAMQNSKEIAGIALVAYCLHKLYSKQHIVRHVKWPAVRSSIGKNIDRALSAQQSGNVQGFEKSLENVIKSIQSIDRELGNYAQGLLEKARVKYASSAYSLGLGLNQSTDLTGADRKEVLRYIGATKMADREAVTFGIGERLQKLKKAIRGK